MTNARKIWLTRHGESVYNQKALIGGDSPLSVNGRAYADVLPEVIMSRLPKVNESNALLFEQHVMALLPRNSKFSQEVALSEAMDTSPEGQLGWLVVTVCRCCHSSSTSSRLPHLGTV